MKTKINPDVQSLSYKECGVNIDEGSRFVSKIKKIVSSWHRPELMKGIGGFGGLFDISSLGMKHPVLVTSIDGVGTKLNIARMMKKHDSVGMDIVNHCVNDILVQGAKPLYFTDYIGTGRLDADCMEQVVKGMFQACKDANCELIGGETAEMPGMYKDDEYDLVGSITGVVEKEKIITGDRLVHGDVLISLPSNGLHTNGYSLARKIVFDIKNLKVDSYVEELECSIGEALLVPHRCFGPLMYGLFDQVDIKGMAHITGGGITDNLPRIFPKGIGAEIKISSIQVLPIFHCLQKWGGVELMEMMKVFNMGVGMVLAVSQEESELCLKLCRENFPGSAVIGRIIQAEQKAVKYI
ncbi:MAG: phosphoribosylformylglycinamidine cyclo-ligase [Candidatus Aureabacteria bacterium]|nr:phosphoribosylformylglycinamidine cyclo-ligase [Candidatus Auribacterota bacterium]